MSSKEPNLELVLLWHDTLYPEGDSMELAYTRNEAIPAGWSMSPIAAWAPWLIEPFQEITDELGELYDHYRADWKLTMDGAPLLFRLGCEFEEAIGNFLESSFENENPERERSKLERARMLFGQIAALATLERGAQDNGAPDNGAPDNGAPDNGAPDNGAPDNGAQDNGAQDNGAQE